MVSNILAILSIVLVLIFSCIKKQLTLFATITAVFVGLVLYFCGGWLLLTALYVFFISSVIVSSIKKNYKKENLLKIHKKAGKRDSIQVFANSLIAVIFSIIYSITGNQVFLIASLIAFACYNADTWASELGIISKKTPRFILGFKQVQKGVSGGVTTFGILSSLVGASLIAILCFIFNIEQSHLAFLVIILFGFLGAIIDSILGQLFQALYYDETIQKYTERKDNNKKIKGYDIVTNDIVNFISPLISTLIYVLVA